MREVEVYEGLGSLTKLTFQNMKSPNIFRASERDGELDDLPFIIRDERIFYIPQNSETSEMPIEDFGTVISHYKDSYSANAYRIAVRRTSLFNNPCDRFGLV